MGNTYRSKAYKRGRHSKGFYNALARFLRRSAAKRGIAWNIEMPEFLALIKADCYICGAKPSNRFKSPHSDSWQGRIIVWQGIDRVNSKLGYVVGNVKPCCKRCNIMKHEMTLTGLKKHVGKIIKHGSVIKLGVRKPILLKIGAIHGNDLRPKSTDKT